MGGSEDLVEPAGQGLAGGASLRAWLLMSPVCRTSLGRTRTRTRPMGQFHRAEPGLGHTRSEPGSRGPVRVEQRQAT